MVCLPLIVSGCAIGTKLKSKPEPNTYCLIHETFLWEPDDSENTIDNIVRDNFRYECICSGQPPEECSYD